MDLMPERCGLRAGKASTIQYSASFARCAVCLKPENFNRERTPAGRCVARRAPSVFPTGFSGPQASTHGGRFSDSGREPWKRTPLGSGHSDPMQTNPTATLQTAQSTKSASCRGVHGGGRKKLCRRDCPARVGSGGENNTKEATASERRTHEIPEAQSRRQEHTQAVVFCRLPYKQTP